MREDLKKIKNITAFLSNVFKFTIGISLGMQIN